MIYTRRTQNWELVSRDEKMNVRFVGQAINRIYAVLLVNSFYKVITENVFTFTISVLLKMAQMRLFSRREVKQVWERASDIRLRLATRLIKLGISNQGALRWHLNENRYFFLLGSLNYLWVWTKGLHSRVNFFKLSQQVVFSITFVTKCLGLRSIVEARSFDSWHLCEHTN